MMKTMITENGVTFKELERNIYSWVCEIGCQFTGEFLERYDRMLMDERDKSRYRHKGTRKATIKVAACRHLANAAGYLTYNMFSG